MKTTKNPVWASTTFVEAKRTIKERSKGVFTNFKKVKVLESTILKEYSDFRKDTETIVEYEGNIYKQTSKLTDERGFEYTYETVKI